VQQPQAATKQQQQRQQAAPQKAKPEKDQAAATQAAEQPDADDGMDLGDDVSGGLCYMPCIEGAVEWFVLTGLLCLAPPARYCCLQLDFEGLDAGNADGGEDEEDDFEAQMRALEEGL
jgi:hypothetical protein